MALLQYAIDVIEGISATVSGGVYNLVSHTPVNPLLLDSTAQGLLEQMAGTSLEVLKNDLGETIGYAAKGVASAGNGAATEVSTRIAVLTKETVVDAEMAAGSYIEASTGAAAELTVGETVTEISAAGSGAGILATEVGAAGAAIAPALGLVAGLALYNIAPEFWTAVSEKLVAAGETIGGKVMGLVNTDGTTSYSKETIEIYKKAFLDAGYYNDSLFADPEIFEPYTQDEINLVSGLPWKESTFNGYNNLYMGYGYAYFEVMVDSPDVACFVLNPIHNESDAKYYITFSTKPYKFKSGLNLSEHEIFNQPWVDASQFTDSDGNIFYGARDSRWWPVIDNNGMYLNIYVDPARLNWRLIGDLLFKGKVESNKQKDAVLPDEAPFPQTYPDWQPNKQIQGKDYYPVSEPTDDITQAPSQSGQNDSDEQQDKIESKLYEPSPDPTPQPQPDPDPEPQPTPEKPLPQEIIPAPDPINPNPDPEPSDPTPVVPVPGSTLVGRMYTVYNPTEGQVNSLGAYLWDFDIIEQIKKMWEDPMQAIISFHKVYCTPSTGSTQNIMLGYLDSQVPSKVVTSQFAEVDCGTLYVAERLGNATDYPPFTKIHLFLPFIGIVELDPTDIMGGYIHIKYTVDVYTGTCVAMIFVRRAADMATEQMLYTFSGNASQQLPLTAANFAGAVSGLLSLAGAGLAVATGGALGAAMGFGSAAHSLTQEMIHVQRSSGLSANAGIMTPRKPMIFISRQAGYDANNYASYYGYPANKTVYLSNCSGFVRVKDINLKTTATDREADEIIQLLKEGVIL